MSKLPYMCLRLSIQHLKRDWVSSRTIEICVPMRGRKVLFICIKTIFAMSKELGAFEQRIKFYWDKLYKNYGNLTIVKHS